MPALGGLPEHEEDGLVAGPEGSGFIRQIHGQMTGAFTEVVTQYSMTEISIEIDEFGQIEHREVTIEHTEEIRFLSDGTDPNDPFGRGSNGQG